MKLYPMKLIPVCKDIIWGGRRLGRCYGKKGDKIAESWELAVNGNDVSVIANGEYAGMGLDGFLGDGRFPVLIKFIDAEDWLSIQVHPHKTEMWYIVEAEQGAQIAYGLKESFDEKSFRKAIETNTVENIVRYTDVKAGDVYFIPSGLIHAIGKGILIAEIQENSTDTYRVYDYGRLQNGKPRELHIEQAISVIRDWTEEDIQTVRFGKKRPGRNDDTLLASCDLFTVNKYEISGKSTLSADDSFVCVICLDGGGKIESESIKKGDTFFVPQEYGKFALTSDKGMTVIATRV